MEETDIPNISEGLCEVVLSIIWLITYKYRWRKHIMEVISGMGRLQIYLKRYISKNVRNNYYFRFLLSSSSPLSSKLSNIIYIYIYTTYLFLNPV